MKKLNGEYGEVCSFCNEGSISIKFIKEGVGSCSKCVSNIPNRIHIEQRLDFLKTKLINTIKRESMKP